MKPLKLVLNAFGPFCKKIEIPFHEFGESGLFLLTGDTGAGKTTIFDAISFALFGNASGENRTPDCFRSDYATGEEKTFVELTFLHKAKCYQVKRNPAYERSKLKSTGTTMEKADATLVMPDGAVIAGSSKVTAAVVDLLGIDWRQYKQIAMIAQGEFLQLLTADSVERGAIFRKVFGTQIFEEVQKKLKSMSNNLKYRCEDLDKSILQFLKGISCDMEDDLSVVINEWKSKPDINQVDNVLEILANLISKDLLLFEQEQAVNHTISEKIKRKAAEYTNAQKLNQAFLELEKSKEQYLALLAHETMMQQLDRVIQQGRKALYTVRPAEESYQRVLSESNKLKTAILQQQQEEERITKELTTFKVVWEEREATCPEIDKLNIRIKRQEDDKIKYDLVEELNAKYNKALVLKDQLNQELKSLEVQHKDLVTQQKEKEKEQDSYCNTDRDLVDYSNQLEQKRKSLIKYKEILDQYEELKAEKTQLERLQVLFEQAQQQYMNQNDQYLKMEHQFLREQAGIIAGNLVEGQPCPVCGSKEHPQKAVLTKEAPSEVQLKQAGTKREELQKKMTEASSNCRNQLTKIELLQGQLQREITEELKRDEHWINENRTEHKSEEHKIEEVKHEEFNELKLKEVKLKELKLKEITLNELDSMEDIPVRVKKILESEEDAARELQNKVQNLREKLKQKELCINRLQILSKELEQNETLYQGKTEDKAALVNQLSMLEGQLTAVRGDLLYSTKEEAEQALVADRKKYTELQRALQQAEENYRSCETKLGELKAVLADNEIKLIEKDREQLEAEAEWKEKLESGGFTDYEQYKVSLITEAELEEKQLRLDTYLKNRSTLEQDLKRLTKETEGKEKLSLILLEKEQEELDMQKQENEARLQTIYSRRKINEEIIKNAQETYREQESLRKEFLMVSELSKTANGELAGKAKIPFEQYVQAFYFNSIINEANKRLYKMTNSQFALMRKEDPTNLRSSTGLELEVMDYYTGKPRSIKSLSGGESFKAALSLALGLSDVIQNFAGGIQVDAMFIDEGFGSLDSNSLEQAIETLNTLTMGNRLVGIISHVSELKERIDKKIVITKKLDGSDLTLIK
jgi:DNA repair protein SbcC/Rad50